MFLLFSGQDYYPRGGWDDYVGRYNLLIDAQAAADKHGIAYEGDYDNWQHIVDFDSGKILIARRRTYASDVVWEPWDKSWEL